MMTNEEFDKQEKEIDNAVRLALSIFVIAILLFSLAVLGYMTKQDNDNTEKYYCQMVHEGVQPDYNESYKQGKCPKSGEAK